MFDIMRKSVGAIACMVGFLLAAPQANATVLHMVDTISGTFMDISATGTALGLADDGEVDITTTVSNMIFGGGTVRVGANGGARFSGTGADLFAVNNPIPANSAFSGGQALLPFYDDILATGTANGEIYWQEIANTLIIQWDDVTFFQNVTDHVTFQMQIFGTGGPAFAQFLYQDIEGPRANGGASATIGYQDGDTGNNDVQWSYKTAGSVGNGTVLSLVGETVTDVPEPGTLGIMGLGLLGIGLGRRKRVA